MESVVLLLETFPLVALFRIQVVQTGFVGVRYVLDLLLVTVHLVLHVSLFTKEAVEMSALLVVLVLDVHIERLDILRLRVTSMFVKSQIIIS